MTTQDVASDIADVQHKRDALERTRARIERVQNLVSDRLEAAAEVGSNSSQKTFFVTIAVGVGGLLTIMVAPAIMGPIIVGLVQVAVVGLGATMGSLWAGGKILDVMKNKVAAYDSALASAFAQQGADRLSAMVPAVAVAAPLPTLSGSLQPMTGPELEKRIDTVVALMQAREQSNSKTTHTPAKGK